MKHITTILLVIEILLLGCTTLFINAIARQRDEAVSLLGQSVQLNNKLIAQGQDAANGWQACENDFNDLTGAYSARVAQQTDEWIATGKCFVAHGVRIATTTNSFSLKCTAGTSTAILVRWTKAAPNARF